MTEWIRLPHQTREALRAVSLPENRGELKESFFRGTALFRDFAERDPLGLTVLGLYLDWMEDTRDRYEALGIPESCFRDSMKDITIWCEDHLERFGKPGFLEWDWVGRSLRLEVIRIGRLQFEPTVLPREAEGNGRRYLAGTPMLDVHIPAGEPLDTEAALDAMNRAPEFFRRYFHREFPLLHCHSWLLGPELKEVLPEGSRILRFQNLFTVYQTDHLHRQAEERIFGFLSDDAGRYPEGASLQRAAKGYLLEGKKFSMGAGIRET